LYGTALEALAEAAAAGIEHLLPGGERSDDDAPNPPYAIFGHSMGAWIAFEMTRAIERRRSARAAAAAATAATTAATTRASASVDGFKDESPKSASASAAAAAAVDDEK
jgi:surfactin synthase thioesterase subunit